MKTHPVKFKFRAEFDLMPSWLPQLLQDWLEQGWTCDITVKRVKGCYGPKTVRVMIEASTSEDVAAVCVANGVSDTKAINRVIDEADGDLRRVKRSVWAMMKGGTR